VPHVPWGTCQAQTTAFRGQYGDLNCNQCVGQKSKDAKTKHSDPVAFLETRMWATDHRQWGKRIQSGRPRLSFMIYFYLLGRGQYWCSAAWATPPACFCFKFSPQTVVLPVPVVGITSMYHHAWTLGPITEKLPHAKTLLRLDRLMSSLETRRSLLHPGLARHFPAEIFGGFGTPLSLVCWWPDFVFAGYTDNLVWVTDDHWHLMKSYGRALE
jgi:hypothetical protein